MHSREEAVRPEGVRVITVNNQRLRVAIRPGNGSRNPLLLMNGIGVNLELLQVFVDALARMATPRSYTELPYLKEADPDLSSEGLKWESEVVSEAAPALRLGGSRGYLYQLLAGMGWTSLPWLWLIRQPTLILAGNEDPILPLINAKIM